MQHIAMIGGGLAGTLVAMHLVRQAQRPLCITIFDQQAQFQTGIAYAQSDFHHLLNVAAGKMSAWPDQPLHFVKWLQQQPAYANIDAALLAQTYLPRALYGQYLQQQWQQTVQDASCKNIQLKLLAVSVTKLRVLPGLIALSSAQGEVQFDAVVVATGNELPRHPLPAASGLTAITGYQHNPWQAAAKQLSADSRVLILGNGLTMVDTVLALRQAGVRSPIMSLSPHGYSMLPHRVSAVKLPDFASTLGEQPSLRQALRLFNQQRKQLRQLGISAEGLVDNLRPLSQLWWRGFSTAEKQFFFKKLRHLWGVARHRLPLQIHDQIQQLRLQGALEVRAGRLLSCQQHGPGIEVCGIESRGIDVRFIAKGQTEPELRQVDHIINCTGPENCYPRLANHLLATAIAEGVLASGPLELGLAACPTSLALKNSSGNMHPRLFGIGSVLRGELWETTALNEIRQQAQQLAGQLLTLE